MRLVPQVLYSFALFFCFAIYSAYAENASYAGPDDEKAVLAAEDSLKRLGKERGALLINGRSLEIIGLEISVSGDSVSVKKTLEELDAKTVGMEIQISLSGDVLFDFDKWDVRPEAEESLSKVAKVVRELKKNNILIEGHTDSKGSDSYNLELSIKRANSVKNWLIAKGGLREPKFVTKGYGETKPIEPNTNPDGSDNAEGRAKNRRVEIRIR